MSESVATFSSANSGMKRATGSAISSLPSSASIIAEREVNGLVIEAITEDRIDFHRSARFAVTITKRYLVRDLAAPRDQCDGAGYDSFVDV